LGQAMQRKRYRTHTARWVALACAGACICLVAAVVGLLIWAGDGTREIRFLPEDRLRLPKAPLDRAAAEGNCELVEQLLAAGADVNKDSGYGTPLEIAAKRGHVGVMVILIVNGALLDVKTDWHGQTPLFEAACRGHTQAVELLLASGADVTGGNAPGSRPLDVAAARWHADVVALLVDAGADINGRDAKTGRTPLHEAVAHTHAGVVQFRIETRELDPRDAPAFARTLQAKQQETVKVLIAKGADLNARDAEGKTPLRLAVTTGDRGIAEILRQHGANE
jgi:ankyrin repeat protein